MSSFQKIKIPPDGSAITLQGGQLSVPDNPIIPFCPGDGIGPEIWAASKTVLDAAILAAYGGKRKIAWMEVYAGLSALKTYGKDAVIPDETLEAIRKFHVAIKGPLTTPVGGSPFVCLSCAQEMDAAPEKRPTQCSRCEGPWVTPRFRSVNVTLRQKLDLYACVRPVRWFTGLPHVMKNPELFDITLFRENTEDVYAGIEFEYGTPEQKEVYDFLTLKMGKKFKADSGIGIKPISKSGTQRLVRKAVRYAIDHQKPSVTLIHKGNIQKFTEGAFRDWGYEVAKAEFRDHIVTQAEVWNIHNGKTPSGKVLIKDHIADQAFQQLLLDPETYSVLATPNLNGDYLSDAAAAQVGGLGIAPGANIGEETAIFEATHGTAPQYAGKDMLNPGSLILSGAMLLEHLGWKEAADLTVKAFEETIQAKTVTWDLEKQIPGAVKLKTSEFGAAVAHRIDQKAALTV